MKRVAGLVLTAALLISPVRVASASATEAEAVVALTRETRATYSVFFWNVVTKQGEPTRGEWSAEFHKGALHRVETPRDRIVADCAQGTGAYLKVQTGLIYQGPEVAKAACGIQANSKVLAMAFLGAASGPFGKTRSIRIRDPENIRTYEVASSGAIVAATIDDLESRPQLRSKAMRLFSKVPDGIFSESSLSKSAVPVQFRSRLP